MKVLVISAGSMFREQTKEVLAQLGDFHLIGWFMTASEGVNQVMALKPDLVLIDSNVGERESVDALELVKFARPAIKVIMMSVNFPPEWVRKSMAAGADHVLGKPLVIDELLRVLELVVE